MSKQLTPDICVIGAGSGGLSVAAAAAAFGVEVVLIEKGLMGGDCLNYGCVPSKALLSAGKKAFALKGNSAMGVSASGIEVDFGQANDHVRAVIAAIAPHDSVERFEGLGVTVLQNQARFVSPDCVVAGDAEIRARRFVVATGSSAAVPPIPGLSDVPYLTNETLFGLRAAPEHLIIIGGGPIGMEMAQAHRRLGAQVTVIEAQKALGKDDPELSAVVLDRIREEGVDLYEQTAVTSVEARDSKIIVHIEGAGNEPTSIEGSHLLVAAGRKPSVDGLDLEKAGITFDRNGISVDKGLRTSNRKVYAIGDVTGGLQFTHVAGYHAGLVIRSILFRLPISENRDIIPWVTYTSPELGHVGMTEAQARERFGGKVKILSADYSGNDRAQAEAATQGRLKLIAGPGGKLLGADIVGAQAGEIINLLSLAVSQGMKMKDLAGFVAAYPTLGELVRRAAISYYAEAPKKPWIRQAVRFLQVFG
ncbi:pyruvate/2-oxoglutarate dehydrogenase complex dihydrolipoamide dehydrogenase (E3) component [Roseibium hamelinense]|uniref:Pyruvate/2-oxoglutarate dehydrogenase complex dihydrolipoamide dehydrogenase (E3) component n=1 Tax=Roseibium hamelinense TaxID=150831 RepID=A0A562SHR0_9HYPH|nr:FAD-dependent oxidoreductase [Roseibium hamelinense]MTI43883.1 dihydrolipoamide dehydrogenase [Roseibium hamelinense]TWI80821.1 pyruvate/2-oxoglutarate dehydrogenase complex dihydrolipoamide dehydrogenase (E3) component [Roseibium hamelinense]